MYSVTKQFHLQYKCTDGFTKDMYKDVHRSIASTNLKLKLQMWIHKLVCLYNRILHNNENK